MQNKDVNKKKNNLTAVNDYLSGMLPEIRLAVFELIKPYIEKGIPFSQEQKRKGSAVNTSVRDFFVTHDPQKPADATLILAAWLYTQRGNTAFSLDELYKLFDEVGSPRPNKVNMTLRTCSRKGKILFMSAGHGKFRPNINGENYFKSDMNLRPSARDT